MVRRRVPLPALVSALVLGGLWWWAVLRLALVPERTGLVEGAVAASGWGLSLLPVHVAAAPRPRRGGAGGGGGPVLGAGSGGAARALSGGRRARWPAAVAVVRDSFPEALRGVVWDVVRAVRGRGSEKK